jgi:outer membrane protein assembly factor BamB
LSQAPRRVGCAGFLRARLPAFKTGNQIVSSPAVANGVVYATSTDDTVYALNATTGALLWSYVTSTQIVGSPIVVNGHLYATDENTLYAFNSPSAGTSASAGKPDLNQLHPDFSLRATRSQ